METGKKKDALTELIDIAGSQTDQPSNNGTVSTPTGEKVELGFALDIREVAKKILWIFKKREAQEREVLEYIVKKDYERKKTN
mgnify:CR=1 FL=1